MTGAMIAIHAAAAAKARTNVLDTFRVRGATAADRSLRLEQLGLRPEDPALLEMLKSGVVRGVDARGRDTIIGDEMSRPETFYLDEPTLIAQRDRGATTPNQRAILVVVMVSLLVILWMLTTLIQSRG
jgi:hypothetical protein